MSDSGAESIALVESDDGEASVCISDLDLTDGELEVASAMPEEEEVNAEQEERREELDKKESLTEGSSHSEQTGCPSVEEVEEYDTDDELEIVDESEALVEKVNGVLTSVEVKQQCPCTLLGEGEERSVLSDKLPENLSVHHSKEWLMLYGECKGSKKNLHAPERLYKIWPWFKVSKYTCSPERFEFTVSAQTYSVELDDTADLRRIFQLRWKAPNHSTPKAKFPKGYGVPPPPQFILCRGCGKSRLSQDAGHFCMKCETKANVACHGCGIPFHTGSGSSRYCYMCRDKAMCNAKCLTCRKHFFSSEVPPSPLCGPCSGGPKPALPGADGSGKKKKKSKRGSKEGKKKLKESQPKLEAAGPQSGWSTCAGDLELLAV